MATNFNADISESVTLSDLNQGSTFFADVSEVCVATDSLRFYFYDPLTPTTFRLQFPAFADSNKYPDRQVSFYIGMAQKLLNPARWCDMIKEGYALFVAHFLSMNALAASSASNGIPGSAVGIINSGSVDKVSFGRDVASVMVDNAGHWGMSVYGLQYLQFARMFGMGPVQVGAGDGWPNYAYGSNLGPDSAYLFGGSGAQNAQGTTPNGGAWPGPQFPYSGW